MLILRSSPASPFGRKVKIAASVLGLMDRITIDPADTANPEDTLRIQNPLGKIPALILEDGTVLYDSRVIVEYLDFIAGGGRIIPADIARFDVLRLQALADGINDASILQVYEKRVRPEERRHPDWVAYQADKVARALSALEAAPPRMVTSGSVDIGEIALACALGYLDLRFKGVWRDNAPHLAAWLGSFEAHVPMFAKTRIEPVEW
ncbi:glutathione S-transferase [Pannonibacter sp. SL95]|uniref:glutathione S-transferase n=1 Tax=Pannonibacter sp. SL95 TaxID=2995153 RepID=UPI0022733C66|nr:glutathione S-transferase N-terminal domain-containing protein [Pannonibacter sp. SL95]MCY1705357.1 glutathione S-transferase N-terminal domain-containing protein [Pannonibacter sp. SL95]